MDHSTSEEHVETRRSNLDFKKIVRHHFFVSKNPFNSEWSSKVLFLLWPFDFGLHNFC